MDFGYHYTNEQEEFRGEVRTWLESNVPDNMTEPVDAPDLTAEQYALDVN